MKNKKKGKEEVKTILFRLNPKARRQFGILAAEEEKTLQSMFIEALNDLFKKYKKDPIA